MSGRKPDLPPTPVLYSEVFLFLFLCLASNHCAHHTLLGWRLSCFWYPLVKASIGSPILHLPPSIAEPRILGQDPTYPRPQASGSVLVSFLQGCPRCPSTRPRKDPNGFPSGLQPFLPPTRTQYCPHSSLEPDPHPRPHTPQEEPTLVWGQGGEVLLFIYF